MTGSGSTITQIRKRLVTRLLTLIVAGLVIAASATDTAHAKEGAEEGAGKKGAAMAYIALPTMSVSLLERNRIRGVLSLKVSLEVEGKKTGAEVKKQLPRLRDAYLRALSNLAQTHLDPDERINMALLQHVLQKTTDRMFGADAAGVLIQHALIRHQ